MLKAREYWTLWVCVNCIMHHANGECGDCPREEGHEGGEPLSNVDYRRSAMGLMSEEHSEDCVRHSQENEYPEDCDCETNTFSTSTCQGCGSDYCGERHAMTEWGE